MRAKNLYSGIERFIGKEYASRIYNHSLIKNLAKEKKYPSYISTERFSSVLLDIIAKEKKNKPYASCKPDEIREIVENVESPLREVLCALFDSGTEEKDNLRSNLSKWFDEGMERIGGCV